MVTDEIIRLPPVDKHLGRCLNCNRNMWLSDLYTVRDVGPVYRCPVCKCLMLKDSIIPF